MPRLVEACPVPISVDTYKAETADYAMRTGAHIMNDIWGLQYAPEPGQMAAVAAKYGVPVVVMHNQDGTEYGDIRPGRHEPGPDHHRPGHRLWQDL